MIRYIIYLYCLAVRPVQKSWKLRLVGWLVGFGLTTLSDSISVCLGPPPGERVKEERKDSREKKMSKQPPTSSTVNPCPTIIQISRSLRHCKFSKHHHTTRPAPQNLQKNLRIKFTETGTRCSGTHSHLMQAKYALALL